MSDTIRLYFGITRAPTEVAPDSKSVAFIHILHEDKHQRHPNREQLHRPRLGSLIVGSPGEEGSQKSRPIDELTKVPFRPVLPPSGAV